MQWHQSGFLSVFSRSSSYSLWKLPLELAVIGALVRNLSRGAENRKDVDMSHPQSKAVSTAGLKSRKKQVTSCWLRGGEWYLLTESIDNVWLSGDGNQERLTYCKNRGNTWRSEQCGCILRCSKGHRRPVLMARDKSAKCYRLLWFSALSLPPSTHTHTHACTFSLFLCMFVCLCC